MGMASSVTGIVRNSIPPLFRGFRIGKASVSKVKKQFGSLVAQTDASGGHKGGAVGWIVRDYKNNCIAHSLVWIPGIVESTCLELYGIKHLLNCFAGTDVPLEIVTDCKGAIRAIHKVKNSLDKGYSASDIIQEAELKDKKKSNNNNNHDRQRQSKAALDILAILRERYPDENTVLKLVNRRDTELSHFLSNFVRRYFEDVQDIYEGERCGDYEVWDDDAVVRPVRKLKLLREHSMCTDTYKCTDDQYGTTSGGDGTNFVFSDEARSPSLGVETRGGVMQVLIPRNVVGPVKVYQQLSTYFDYQETELIQIFEGERSKTKYNRVWGKLEIDIAPAPKGVPKIAVCFEINTSNCLSVSVCVEKQEFVINGPRTKLTEEEIDCMFDQDARNALEDETWKKNMEAKVWWIYQTTKISSILKEESKASAEGQDKKTSVASSTIMELLTCYDTEYVEDAEHYKRLMSKVEDEVQKLSNQVAMGRLVKDAIQGLPISEMRSQGNMTPPPVEEH